MFFKAEVIKEMSFDPYFKIKFSYSSDRVSIINGIVEVVREAPKSVITFDCETDKSLQTADRLKLEFELLNTVIDHLLMNGVRKTFKGNIILNMA